MKSRWALPMILLGAVLVRLAVMGTGLGRLDDPDGYLTLARSVADGNGLSLHGKPTAYRPPLYPILLAPLVGSLPGRSLVWGVGGLHLALGVGTVGLVAWTARRWGFSEARTLVASAIVAFDPVLVVQSKAVMTETPAAFLVALTLAALAVRGRVGFLAGGVGFGLASLCRPSLLPAAILTILASGLVGPGDWKARIRRAVLLGLVTTLTLLPWAWRNARYLGEPVWSTTHGGYTLALANNPAYYADVLDGPPGAIWSGPHQAEWFASVDRSTRGMTEPEADRALRSSAARMLVEHPGSFARASIARLGRFWGLAPSSAVYPTGLRVLTATWTAPLWVALAIGLMGRDSWRWPRIAAIGFIAALSFVHVVYWTDLRMRAPLVPAIGLVAAGARPGRSSRFLGKSADYRDMHAGDESGVAQIDP